MARASAATRIDAPRAARVGIAALAVMLVATGCVHRMPVARDAPRSIAVVCRPGGVDAECFRRASEFCGADGYDLVGRDGRPATVADAEVRIVEARCRR